MGHYILHYDWIIFNCMDVLHFVFLFINWWKFWYCEYHCFEQSVSTWTLGCSILGVLLLTKLIDHIKDILSICKESQSCGHKLCSAEIEYYLPKITHPKVTIQNCHLPWISGDVYENSERRPLVPHSSGAASSEGVCCQKDSKKRGESDYFCQDT
jgi:hypothetical protein